MTLDSYAVYLNRALKESLFVYKYLSSIHWHGGSHREFKMTHCNTFRSTKKPEAHTQILDDRVLMAGRE